MNYNGFTTLNENEILCCYAIDKYQYNLFLFMIVIRINTDNLKTNANLFKQVFK